MSNISGSAAFLIVSLAVLGLALAVAFAELASTAPLVLFGLIVAVLVGRMSAEIW